MAAFTYGVNEEDTYKRIGLRDISKAKSDEINAQYAQYARHKATDMAKAKQQRDTALAAHIKILRNVNTVLNQINGSTLRGTGQVEHDKDLKLPTDYKYKDALPLSVVKPATIMGTPAVLAAGARRTEVFAKWMTSPENPCFTKVLANRLWKQVFGVALIEPLDDLTGSTKAMIPDLEEHLEKLLIARHYDMKAYLAALLNTRAYQAAVTREEYHAGEIYHFPGPILRRMTAEQIWDSFVTLIRPDPDSRNLVAEAESEQRLSMVRKLNDAFMATPPTELFDRSAASVPQALILMNSQLVPQILSPFSPLMLGVNRATTTESKLEAACLTLFSRKPTAREKAVWATACANGMSTADDLVFALLNTQQFVFI